jgi:hypothetical protein
VIQDLTNDLALMTDSGETLPHVAADKILPDDVGNNGSEITVGVGVSLRIDPPEFFIMLFDKAEENRFAGIPRPIDALDTLCHEGRKWQKECRGLKFLVLCVG